MPDRDFPPLRANDYRDAWCGQVLADRVGARRTVILDEDGGCVVRDMESGEQSEADPATVVDVLRDSAG